MRDRGESNGGEGVGWRWIWLGASKSAIDDSINVYRGVWTSMDVLGFEFESPLSILLRLAVTMRSRRSGAAANVDESHVTRTPGQGADRRTRAATSKRWVSSRLDQRTRQ